MEKGKVEAKWSKLHDKKMKLAAHQFAAAEQLIGTPDADTLRRDVLKATLADIGLEQAAVNGAILDIASLRESLRS